MHQTTLVSLKRVLFSSLFLFSFAANAFTVERATLAFNAEPGKAFAVNLPDHTGIKADYSILTGPAWLSVTAEGVLFGTPTAADAGKNEAFVAAIVNDTEHLFELVITVAPSAPAPNFLFTAKVDDIFKADLKQVAKTDGEFTFEGLPKWLKGTSAGILIGAPHKEDVGISNIRANVVKDGKMTTFTLRVTVKPPFQGSQGLVVRVGEMFNMHVTDITKMKGYEHTVWLPQWMSLSKTGYMTGIPRAKDVGTYNVRIDVREGVLKVRTFRFNIIVE